VGLPGVLAHGMLTMGLAVGTVESWIGDTGRILEYGVRFTKPVVVDPESGADVTVVAKVGAVDEGSARIDLTVSCEGTTVLVKAQVRVRTA
jgi:acyl dehydratase